MTKKETSFEPKMNPSKPKYFWPEDIGLEASFVEIPRVKKEVPEWIRVRLGRAREPDGLGIIFEDYEPWGVYRVGPEWLPLGAFVQRLQLDMAYGIINEGPDYWDVACFIEIPSPEGYGSGKNLTKYSLGHTTKRERERKHNEQKKVKRQTDFEWAERQRAYDRRRRRIQKSNPSKHSLNG